MTILLHLFIYSPSGRFCYPHSCYLLICSLSKLRFDTRKKISLCELWYSCGPHCVTFNLKDLGAVETPLL